MKLCKILSIILFVFGILFGGWSLISLNSFFRPQGDNRLPPAGSFIDGPNSFSFAVMSDSALRNEPIRKIIQDIKQRKAKFILHLGDQARRLSNNHFEQIIQDLKHELGEMPLYSVPGNHDVMHDDEKTEKYYHRAFGQSNYWFSYGNSLFIGLNTAFSRFPKQDRKWLENVLKRLRPQFKNCFLFMHIPPQDPRPGHAYAMDRDNLKLEKMLSKHNITTIFCGHIQQFIEATWGNTPMYITPASGQKPRGDSKNYGYLYCTITPENKLEVQNIEIDSGSHRNMFRYFLSTAFDGITSGIISFSSLTAAFILLLISSQLKPRQRETEAQDESKN